MTKQTLILIGTIIFTSCSKQIYVHKTEEFKFDKNSKVFIESNDSLSFGKKYSASWDLSIVDSIIDNKQLRDFDIEEKLENELSENGYSISSDSNNVDYIIRYRDYWYNHKKIERLCLFAVQIESTKDSSAAVVVRKSYSLKDEPIENEITEVVNNMIEPNAKPYLTDYSNLKKFPNTNDIPIFPTKQIGIGFGYSSGFLPWSDYSEKYSDLYSGSYLLYGNLDLDYYYRNFSGIGLKASYYFGNSSFNNVNQLDENNNGIGNGLVSDNINYLFIGPSLIFRVPFYKYRYLDVIKLCPGYIRYYNEAVRFDTPITYEGNTFGFIFSACLDFEINSHLSMGIEPRFSFGGLRKMKINDKIETLESKESLMKVEVSAHFKIH